MTNDRETIRAEARCILHSIRMRADPDYRARIERIKARFREIIAERRSIRLHPSDADYGRPERH